ncbi:MAG: discoidin domain-containing protein, partial [Acidimicrobiales bacterium]
PPSTAAPPPTTAPPSNITGSGVISASSVYSGEFTADLAIDGDPSTSWFSADGGTATYAWDAGGTRLIESVQIISNGSHSNPSFQTGFGFDSVTVIVEDEGGGDIWTETYDLSGTPDPDVIALPAVEGAAVVLSFSGGEDPTCGGFAELIVVGS